MKSFTRALLFVAVAVALPACGGSLNSSIARFLTSDEAEPNDTFGEATSLAVGEGGHGDLSAAGDVDFWAFTGTAGTFINVELWANRLDQATWAANANRARVVLVDTDGVTTLRTPHTAFNSDDNGLVKVQIPAGGTYFLRVFQSAPGSAGGRYVVRVTTVTVPNLQVEAEVGAGATNNSAATAEPITPGAVVGVKAGDEATDQDFYSFVVAAPSIVEFKIHVRQSGLAKDMLLTLLDVTGVTTISVMDDGVQFDSWGRMVINTAATYTVRVEEFGAGGSTSTEAYLLEYSLTPITPVLEAEVNDTFGAANPVAIGDVVSGGLTAATNADFFSFTGSRGDRIVMDRFDGPNTTTRNLEAAADNVVVTFLDTDGVTVLPQFAPTPSTLTLLDSNHVILPANGTYFIRVAADGSPVDTAYMLRLNRVGTASAAGSKARLGKGAYHGIIATAGQVDSFIVAAAEGQLVTVSVFGNNGTGGSGEPPALRGFGSTLVPSVSVFFLDQTPLTTITQAAPAPIGNVNPFPTIEASFIAPKFGFYRVAVTDNGATGGPAHLYVIQQR